MRLTASFFIFTRLLYHNDTVENFSSIFVYYKNNFMILKLFFTLLPALMEILGNHFLCLIHLFHFFRWYFPRFALIAIRYIFFTLLFPLRLNLLYLQFSFKFSSVPSLRKLLWFIRRILSSVSIFSPVSFWNVSSSPLWLMVLPFSNFVHRLRIGYPLQ